MDQSDGKTFRNGNLLIICYNTIFFNYNEFGNFSFNKCSHIPELIPSRDQYLIF